MLARNNFLITDLARVIMEEKAECEKCDKINQRYSEATDFIYNGILLMVVGFVFYQLMGALIKLFTSDDKAEKTLKEKIEDSKHKNKSSSKLNIKRSPQNRGAIPVLQQAVEYSDMDSDSETLEVVPEVKSQAAKVRKPKRSWSSSPTEIVSVSSTTSINKTIQKNANEIIKHGKKIGTISVHPKLLDLLDKEETRVLNNLCSNGHVIDGNTKGKNGLIFIEANKSKKLGYKVKLKNCQQDVRFFATYKYDGDQNDFEVTGYRPSHKDKKIISVRI